MKIQKKSSLKATFRFRLVNSHNTQTKIVLFYYSNGLVVKRKLYFHIVLKINVHLKKSSLNLKMKTF